MSNIPIPPSKYVFEKLQTLRIEPEEGKVYGVNGYELRGMRGLYVVVDVAYARLKRANVIWWKAKGEWPPMLLDHEDRNKTNDKIGNLRLATDRLNNVNRQRSNNLPPGVSVCKSKLKPYVAKMHNTYLGSFATVDEASQRYQQEVVKEEGSAND